MLDLSDYPELLSRPQVAEVLGVKAHRVRYLTEHGLLRSRRVGKNVRVPKSAVLEYLGGSDVAAPTTSESA